MNIDIVSFNRLAYRVFEELAVEHLTVLDDMGKSMVLRKVAAEQRGRLSIYGGHLDQTGFIEQLRSMLSEFYQYGIGTVELLQAARETKSPLLREKCRDLSVILEAFKQEIAERYMAAEEVMDVFCRVLPRSELIQKSVITLDGFVGFTPVQYRILGEMIRCAREVRVTVAMPPSENPYKREQVQHLFYMGKEIVCRLTDLAAREGAEKLPDVLLEPRRFEKSPSIGFIESHLYRYGAWAQWEPEEVEILQAGDPRQEVAQVAARIRALAGEGIRYREMAIVTGDLSGYRYEILNRFEAEGIPCFLDDKKSILENAMVELLRAALEAVRRDFDYESVFRFLKTGLVTEDWEELCRLENYCLAMGIRGFHRWSQPWQYTYRGGKNLNLPRLNAFRDQVMEPLFALRSAMKREDRTVETMTQAVWDCLSACRVREKMEAMSRSLRERGEYSLSKEYEQIYDRVEELLDRLLGLLGQEKVSIREYGEILDAGFAEIQVGVIPATVDRVVAGDLTRTRLDQIKVLFFLGVNEGIVPAKKEGKSLLTDADRDGLREMNLELAPTSREDGFLQRYYLYLMLTKPSQRLYLSYSAFDQAGKTRRPSSLIGELRRLFPRISIREAGDGWESMKKAGLSRLRGKEMLIGGLREFAAGEQTAQEFFSLYRFYASHPDYQQLVEQLVEAAFYSYEKRGISKAAARALYGNIIQGSVTRLEQYAACAYAHFLNYGLELLERQEYQVASADLGNLFHASIDLCFQQMTEKGLSIQEISEKQRKELVDRCVDQVTAEYGNGLFSDSARNRYLAERVRQMTDRTMWALLEQLKKGDFSPEGFEVSFSAIDDLKAMKIRLSEEEELRLRGRIDRLDVSRGEDCVYVKIIDYKSGSTRFDLAAVYYGLQLQLVVYLDAVMELVERKCPGMNVVPAGIFYYNIKDPLAERTPGQTDEDIEMQILKELRMNGLVNSDLEVISRLDRQIKTACDLEVISRLDRQIKTASDVIPVALKDGMVQERYSSVASGKRFEVLRRFVRGQLKKDGCEILEGRIAVEPEKRGSQTACDYCPFHGVCGFDQRVAGYRFRRFPSVKPEEIWEKMLEETGGEEDEMDR